MRVTYSFDERTEDGFTAWRSIQHFKRLVEDPAAAGLASDAAPRPGGEMSPDGARGLASGPTRGDAGPMGAE